MLLFLRGAARTGSVGAVERSSARNGASSTSVRDVPGERRAVQCGSGGARRWLVARQKWRQAPPTRVVTPLNSLQVGPHRHWLWSARRHHFWSTEQILIAFARGRALSSLFFRFVCAFSRESGNIEPKIQFFYNILTTVGLVCQWWLCP